MEKIRDNVTGDAIPEKSLGVCRAEGLPPEYNGAWIEKLVRSFGGSRGMGEDALDDLFQSACLAATRALAHAEAKGGDPSAFVKVAVRHALTDAIRRRDTFAAHMEYAEDAPRGEDVDPDERLIERVPDAKYSPSRNRRINAVRLAALIVSPAASAYWEAFRRTNGSDAAVARCIGVSPYMVAHRIAPRARAEFARAIAIVEAMKGGAR